jgi:hypothetical protein
MEIERIAYETKKFHVGTTEYRVMIASGSRNYVSVRKVGPTTSFLGTEFPTFAAAIAHYKNPTIKVELLKIELGLV